MRGLLLRAATADELAEVDGEIYSNLLWPVRGAAEVTEQPRGVNVDAEPGAPVRAAADGLVIFAGTGLRGLGSAVALLHKNGWVTLYGANRELHVEVGQQVQRGEWIARVGDHLHFQLRDSGASPDPLALFVQRPTE